MMYVLSHEQTSYQYEQLTDLVIAVVSRRVHTERWHLICKWVLVRL